MNKFDWIITAKYVKREARLMSSNKIFIEKASRGASDSSLNDLWGAVSKSHRKVVRRKNQLLSLCWQLWDFVPLNFPNWTLPNPKTWLLVEACQVTLQSSVNLCQQLKRIADHKKQHQNFCCGFCGILNVWLTMMIVWWDEKIDRERNPT